MTDAPVTHAELSAALVRMPLSTSASDLHGSLIGYLCAGGRVGPRHLLDTLQLESGDARIDDQTQALLARLVSTCLEQLDDPQLGFQPLLPDDDVVLQERADAVVEWCRGFLGGFGLVGGAAQKLSADGREVLADLGTIAASQLALDSEHDDEDSLVEVTEFVRVGALLLYAEAGSKPDAARMVH